MVEDARTYLAKRGNVERKDVPPPPLREAPHTLWDALLEQSRARGVPPPNTLPPSLVAHANGTADRDRQRVKIKLKESRNAREAEKKKHVALLAKTRENLHQQPQDPSPPQKGLPALLPEPETSAFWAVVEVRKHEWIERKQMRSGNTLNERGSPHKSIRASRPMRTREPLETRTKPWLCKQSQIAGERSVLQRKWGTYPHPDPTRANQKT